MSDRGRLLQIIPRTPDDCGGVGGYALQLARRLLESYRVTSIFVSAVPADSSRTADGFEVLSPLRTVSDKIKPPGALLLHYVNYGFEPHGIPVGLPSVLRRLKNAGDARLVTVFHEVYASGSWRQSAFWLRPIQRQIARVVAQLSAASIVSNEIQGALLEQLAPDSHIIVQPVASNFGEPSLSSADLKRRDPHRWIICGGNELLDRSLVSFAQNARHIPPHFAPRELFVVGGTDRAEVRAKLGGLRDIHTHYYPKIDDKIAAEILSTCAFAWIDYFHRPDVPMAPILKSTVFAAYCAHGVIPVFPHHGSPIRLRQDILPGPFFVSEAGHNLPIEQERAPVAQSMHDWYQRNASSLRIAETIATAIGHFG